MRFRLWTHRMILGGTALIVVLEAAIIFNLVRINETQFNARRLVGSTSSEIHESLYRLKREALTRAALYERLIEKDMLVNGMVIYRDEWAKAHGLCDSLLFSSIRYRSLLNLGFVKEAEQSWQSIDKSRIGGHWWRHPLCRTRSLSRDMLMGVMMSLAASPDVGRDALLDLLAEIDERGGSFSDGPFFVSYLSPGPAGLLRQVALGKKIPVSQWPWVLRHSFSSIEFDAMFLRPGFESHLAALGVWLEFEMTHNGGFDPRSLLGQFERLWSSDGSGSNSSTSIDHERLLWITSVLSQQNPENLFFVYLRQVVAGEYDDSHRIALLTELLNMPQFPANRLPMDCDRGADYLWQRDADEYLPENANCRRTWSGVDYLWMAGLLVRDP